MGPRWIATGSLKGKAIAIKSMEASQHRAEKRARFSMQRDKKLRAGNDGSAFAAPRAPLSASLSKEGGQAPDNTPTCQKARVTPSASKARSLGAGLHEQTAMISLPHTQGSRGHRSMTQTTGRFFDEIAKLMTDAAGAAQGVRAEVETAARSQAERFFRSMDIPQREEFEAVKAMALKAREENEKLAKRIAELEAALGRASDATTQRP
jgi:BMFP domain-containing protein YqiC